MFFYNTRVVTPMQVIFWGTYWICFWALLQKGDERPHIIPECCVLETMSLEIFAFKGWSFSNRNTFTMFDIVLETVLLVFLRRPYL
jgi:hypothetical protein